MKPLNKTLSAAVATCLLVVFVVGTAFAQGVQPTSELLRIRKLTPLNKSDYEQNAPMQGTRTAKQRNWGVFDVTFEIAPEWVDDMTVTYTLMLQKDRPEPNEKALSLMTLIVTYKDVMKGRDRDRKAGVVISPAALERYGLPIGFSAQIFVAGQLAAEQGVVSGSLRTQQEWWKNPAVIDSPMVQKRDGYMVERSKSVFNLVDIDAYEAGK